jgi:cytochrome d ubiquinol oxidase subunit I
MDAVTLHRLQFAFTIGYHYLFPQLTMGLALLIVVLKTIALWRRNGHYHRAARFWIRIFGINFAMGVATGVPMEFQFGTNWARFSKAAGGVIGQTLAMEGVFSFFLESAFVGLLVFGEKRISARKHWLAAVLVFAGSWLSGYFIIVTNAWMQHPVGYSIAPGGKVLLESYSALLLNPWALWQYLHNMVSSVMVASGVMASIGAFYLLQGVHREQARTFVTFGTFSGLLASVLLIFPTGDFQGKNVAHYQPVTLAAMEGLFQTEHGAPIAILGQPDMVRKRLDNPLLIPNALSMLTYQRWMAEVRGLDAFPEDQWPDNVPLLYFSYHIMVGLGTIFVAVMSLCAWMFRNGRLFESRACLWILMLMLPFPYIATTAGWMTAELGRQPWLIHGLMRTVHGASANVPEGTALFTLIGFMGMYALLSVLFLLLVGREIAHGPEEHRQ